MTTIKSLSQNQKGSTTVHNHPTSPEGYIGKNGRYVCTNKAGMSAWLKCAKKNGSCSGLTYYPEKKHLIFPDTPAEYEYSVKKWDTINMIRSMFNIKDEVLRECNGPIYDINNPYRTKDSQPEKSIYFYEDGILP